MSKVALITGVTGQDGSYLSELLLEKGYEVHGIKRRSSSYNTSRVDHIYEGPFESNRTFTMHYGDMSDSTNIIRLIQKIQPDEIYNLAAMSHVKVSFDMPEYVADVDGIGTLRILEAVRILGLEQKCRIYQASTSELYGKVAEIPQSETTKFHPRSPYAVAKLYAFWITKHYREAYNIFASNGILFNHESPRRGETFVTRKVTMAVARIVCGKKETLYLGNLNAKRDWGHAKDYVELMWMILQNDQPDDWVAATGVTRTVREFVQKAFISLGVAVVFKGDGVNEVGVIDALLQKHTELGLSSHLKKGDIVVRVSPKYFRPAEVDLLLGDSTKAKRELGWSPKISFDELVREMVLEDLSMVINK